MAVFLVSVFGKVINEFQEIAGPSQGKQVVFIATASDILRFKKHIWDNYRDLKKLGFDVAFLDVTNQSTDHISEVIAQADAIFVAGGNAFYLLQILREKGVDQLIKQHIDAGKMYIGESAGAVILSPDIAYIQWMDDRKKAPRLLNDTGLGVLDKKLVPHLGGVLFWRATRQILAKYPESELIVLHNNELLVISSDKMTRMISHTINWI